MGPKTTQRHCAPARDPQTPKGYTFEFARTLSSPEPTKRKGSKTKIHDDRQQE